MLLLDGQVHHDTHVIPMGNYVIGVGNYVIASPSPGELRDRRQMLPVGWLEAGGPIRTYRQPKGCRHVPGGAPGGGYDLSAGVDPLVLRRAELPGRSPHSRRAWATSRWRRQESSSVSTWVCSRRPSTSHGVRARLESAQRLPLPAPDARDLNLLALTRWRSRTSIEQAVLVHRLQRPCRRNQSTAVTPVPGVRGEAKVAPRAARRQRPDLLAGRVG